MAREGKLAPKYKTWDKVCSNNKGSDRSDEDYMVSEDEEFDESDDEYVSSLDDDETEESSGEFEEEKEFDECLKKKIKKVGRPRGRKSSHQRDGAVKTRKKSATYTDFGEEKTRNRTQVLSAYENVDHCNEKPRKKTRVSYREQIEDSDFDNCDEDEDEEFTPDEDDIVDDDEELLFMKENKRDRLKMQEAQSAKGKRRKRNLKALKRTRRNKSVKKKVLRRNNKYHGKEFRDKGHVAHKTERSTGNGRRKRKVDVNSDRDFVSSGLSDYEYTISEEEKEQIREASELCQRIATCSRSSTSLRMIKEEKNMSSERKCPAKKDKEKMVEVKIEVGKQICGICLSEEGKRTVRGILNCCVHYFCFTCIMDWSNVESRCPLCKQRFTTISRTSQVDSDRDLKDVVISVPERDQVYQPSEEELRGYLDPYESVLCTECHQGGDESFMLLCDICDSPAHTYCVGLGREVPEGNWYCDGCRPGCRPAALPSSGNNLSGHSTAAGTIRETFDLNEVYVPETSEANGHSPSPRYSFRDYEAAPSGSGAFTLYERRRIQQQIHVLLNHSRQSERSDDMCPASGISIFGSRISRDGVTSLQAVPALVGPQNIHHQGRLPDYARPSLHGREALQPRSFSLRGQVLHQEDSTSTGHTPCGPSQIEYSGTSARIGHGLGHQQLRPSNHIRNAGMNASTSLSQFREVSPEKAHVQSLVRSHLSSLSRNLDLDVITFKCIARTSTHTILAAVGHEHRRNEVFPVQTRPLTCGHLDSIASHQTCPFAGQCSSCFNWFVGNIVREVMSSRLPLLSED